MTGYNKYNYIIFIIIIYVYKPYKKWGKLLCENGAGKNIVSHSKLKWWTFFWGHGEREWSLKLKYQQL